LDASAKLCFAHNPRSEGKCLPLSTEYLALAAYLLTSIPITSSEWIGCTVQGLLNGEFICVFLCARGLTGKLPSILELTTQKHHLLYGGETETGSWGTIARMVWVGCHTAGPWVRARAV